MFSTFVSFQLFGYSIRYIQIQTKSKWPTLIRMEVMVIIIKVNLMIQTTSQIILRWFGQNAKKLSLDKSQQIIWYFVRTLICLPLRFRPAGCNQKRKEELRFPRQFDKIWCDCAETRLFAPCPGKLAFFCGWLGV